MNTLIENPGILRPDLSGLSAFAQRAKSFLFNIQSGQASFGVSDKKTQTAGEIVNSAWERSDADWSFRRNPRLLPEIRRNVETVVQRVLVAGGDNGTAENIVVRRIIRLVNLQRSRSITKKDLCVGFPLPDPTLDAVSKELESIGCTACGNCCPNTCEFKEDNRCLVHPAVVGEKEATAKRGLGCHLRPAALVTWAHYCPPVVEYIEGVTGIKALPRILPRGNVTIANFPEFSDAICRVQLGRWYPLVNGPQ